MAFTCFPIMIYAVYDQEYTKADLLKTPALYRSGMKENQVTWSKYFVSFFESMVHGFFIFVVAYGFFDNSIGWDGVTPDIRMDGNMCYVSVVLVATFKILFDSNSINILVFLGSFLSIGAYFLFVYVMGLFSELDIFDQLPEMNHFNQQWLVMFLLIFVFIPFN